MHSSYLHRMTLTFFPMVSFTRWGGPLPQSWLDQQLVLQKKIIARMYELGMTPGILSLLIV